MFKKYKVAITLWVVLDISMILFAIWLGKRLFFTEEEIIQATQEIQYEFNLEEKYLLKAQLGPNKFEIIDGVLYAPGGKNGEILEIWGQEVYEEIYYEEIEIAERVIHVDADQRSVIYITKEGELWGFGDNTYGQLGVSPKEGEYIKIPRLIAENVIYADIGIGNVIMLKEDGSVYVTGWNYNGQLGPEMDEREEYLGESVALVPFSHEPSFVMKDAVYVNCGNYTMAAINEQGELFMWGDNSFGEIGNGKRGEGLPTISTYFESEPYLVLGAIKDVRFDNFTVYATNIWDETFVWGENYKSTPEKLY